MNCKWQLRAGNRCPGTTLQDATNNEETASHSNLKLACKWQAANVPGFFFCHRCDMLAMQSLATPKNPVHRAAKIQDLYAGGIPTRYRLRLSLCLSTTPFMAMLRASSFPTAMATMRWRPASWIPCPCPSLCHNPHESRSMSLSLVHVRLLSKDQA